MHADPTPDDPFDLADLMAGIEEATERLLSGIGRYRVAPEVDADQIRQWLERYRFDDPVSLQALVADVEPKLRAWNLHPLHPRHFGLFNPPALPPGVVADALAALYNPQIGAWAHAPVGNEIERHTLARLAGLIGFPPGATLAHFTSGGQEANTTAIIVALGAHLPHVIDDGLRSLTAQPVLYVSAAAHHSFIRAASFTGLGKRAVVTVPVDAKDRMQVSELERLIDRDRRAGLDPFMVVGTLGTTGTGAIDPLVEIAEVARRERIWFHVDAAWGGTALLSPRLRGLCNGIAQADSVTWDAHKWMSVPMGAGMFFCRHPQAMTHAFSSETGYVPHATDPLLEQYQTTAQWSRRFIGLKVFFSLAHFGLPGYARMVDHQCAMADRIRERGAGRGWQVTNETALPIVCLTHHLLQSGEEVEALVQRVVERGHAWVSSLRLPDGAAVVRVCITNPRTETRDVDILLDELETAIVDIAS